MVKSLNAPPVSRADGGEDDEAKEAGNLATGSQAAVVDVAAMEAAAVQKEAELNTLKPELGGEGSQPPASQRAQEGEREEGGQETCSMS